MTLSSSSQQQSTIGANILKRTIEHLCSDQWSEDRAGALEIVNAKLEECFAAEVVHSHYICGNGEPGCLYDGCAVVRTLDDAVSYLSDMFSLGRTRRADLKRSRYLSLNSARDGAGYCEITACNCATPWVHDEQMMEEDWNSR
jgi:hypothetical protein